MLAYNRTYQASIKATPAMALLGYNPEFEVDVEQEGPAGEVLDGTARVQLLQDACELVKDCIHHTQEAQKKYYDKKHQPKTFHIGDWVML